MPGPMVCSLGVEVAKLGAEIMTVELKVQITVKEVGLVLEKLPVTETGMNCSAEPDEMVSGSFRRSVPVPPGAIVIVFGLTVQHTRLTDVTGGGGGGGLAATKGNISNVREINETTNALCFLL